MRLKASSTRSCCGSPPPPRWSLCWRVRCTDCGQWVSKHDFTEADALAAARSHRETCPTPSDDLEKNAPPPPSEGGE